MGSDSISGALLKALEKVRDEGVESQREQLLLWVIRNQHGLSPEDSYASILNEREIFPSSEVDAMAVTVRRDLISPVYFLYDQSATEIKKRVVELSKKIHESSKPEIELARRNSQFRSLLEAVTDDAHNRDLDRVITCVVVDALTPAQKRSIRNSASPEVDVNIIDIRFLNALAEVEAKPTESIPPVRVTVAPESILDLEMANSTGIVVAVPAEQIAEWPGIDDRTIFDLNVRHALGINRVRRSLDSALQDSEEADNFIAYHNGITAVCSSFSIGEQGIVIEGLSVVNGAQTVVAIRANEDELASGLRVILKLIEASPDSALARHIAVRSNTQNPVTSRNLRALDESQVRLSKELKQLGYVYLRRPNDRAPSGDRVINNDDAAQLLCSIYVRKPALAVKRQVLFEWVNYSEIFPNDLDPAKVIFCDIIRRVVDSNRDLAPLAYQRAWTLTRLTIVNMVAEAMRDDRTGRRVLEKPSAFLVDEPKVEDLVVPFVRAACDVLDRRAKQRAVESQEDDYKVAFKQTRTLSDLAMQCSKTYRRDFSGAVR